LRWKINYCTNKNKLAWLSLAARIKKKFFIK
jgi:hypothetical protein